MTVILSDSLIFTISFNTQSSEDSVLLVTSYSLRIRSPVVWQPGVTSLIRLAVYVFKGLAPSHFLETSKIHVLIELTKRADVKKGNKK